MSVAQKIALVDEIPDKPVVSVFSPLRKIESPAFVLPKGLHLNRRKKMDGLKFLSKLTEASVPVAFFDPQYRGILDKLNYGNEGEKRGKARASLPQMSEKTIADFMQEIDRILIPSGHLFLWIDKFHLCMGFSNWLDGTTLEVVDMVTWDKDKMGMGYRTRRKSEYVIVLQKSPRKAKGIWSSHTIPDVWQEGVKKNGFPHTKPVQLQKELIGAVSHPGDIIVDPAAGSFSVMEACKQVGRNFLGCDING